MYSQLHSAFEIRPCHPSLSGFFSPQIHIFWGGIQLFHSVVNYAIRQYVHALCLPWFFNMHLQNFKKIPERRNTRQLFWTFSFPLYLETLLTGTEQFRIVTCRGHTAGWERPVFFSSEEAENKLLCKTKGGNIARAGTLKHHHCSVCTAISFQKCILHPLAPMNNNLHFQLLPEAWQNCSGGRTNRKEFVITICRGCARDDVTKGKPTHTRTATSF